MAVDLDKLLLADLNTLKPTLRRALPTDRENDLSESAITHRINTALGGPISRSQTLVGFLRESDVSKTTMRRKAPELLRKLVQYFDQRRKEERRVVLNRRLQLAVQLLRQHGPKVSNNVISKAMICTAPHTEFFAKARNLAFPKPHAQFE
jgi:hypothetical protein